MSDNIDKAFNYIDARVNRLRQWLEQKIEENVMLLHNAVKNRTITPSIEEAINKAEKKQSAEINKLTVDNVRELENEVIKTFGLPDDKNTRVNLRTYIFEKVNA